MDAKQLTFKSTNLGDTVPLMLCFFSSSPDLFKTHFPIAWMVRTLAARGRSKVEATWTRDLGFCTARSDSRQLVTTGNYTPIKIAQTTSLQLDTRKSPPVYVWTDPKTNPSVTTVQATNGTNSPVGMGLGFITEMDTDFEAMNAAVMYPNVGPGLTVVGQFAPVIRAYVGLDYQETQLIGSNIQSIKPVWQGTFDNLGPRTTIAISKTAGGGYESRQHDGLADENVGHISPAIDWLNGVTRLYRATLSFATSELVQSSLKMITERLLTKGYRIKVISKNHDVDVRIELVLPINTSYNQAEKEILGYIEGHDFPSRAAIKERAGELMVHSADRLSCWTDINPAHKDWYTGKSDVPDDSEAGTVENQFANLMGEVSDGSIAGETTYNSGKGKSAGVLAYGNGGANGGASGSAGLLGSDLALEQAPVSYGKTRTVGRKVSTSSLAA